MGSVWQKALCEDSRPYILVGFGLSLIYLPQTVKQLCSGFCLKYEHEKEHDHG